jgi:hypothetical protein
MICFKASFYKFPGVSEKNNDRDSDVRWHRDREQNPVTSESEAGLLKSHLANFVTYNMQIIQSTVREEITGSNTYEV